MEPEYKEGDFVIRNPLGFLFSSAKPGDVVLFHHPVKQIVLLKRVWRVKKERGQEYVWVQGDNLAESSDSRNFGWIAAQALLGKTWLVRKA